ncbi:MAG: DUF3293 domain-containing protein, partial [Planctomycetes bacterium]|nr:DUF3293 domain-containing protein [Planctomycetota bacterium]
MSTTRIPVATLEAFRATCYAVDAEPPFVLRIDEPNAALAALHAATG